MTRSLPSKFALLAFVIAGIGVLGMATYSYQGADRFLRHHHLRRLVAAMQQEQLLLAERVDHLRRQAGYLAYVLSQDASPPATASGERGPRPAEAILDRFLVARPDALAAALLAPAAEGGGRVVAWAGGAAGKGAPPEVIPRVWGRFPAAGRLPGDEGVRLGPVMPGGR